MAGSDSRNPGGTQPSQSSLPPQGPPYPWFDALHNLTFEPRPYRGVPDFTSSVDSGFVSGPIFLPEISKAPELYSQRDPQPSEEYQAAFSGISGRLDEFFSSGASTHAHPTPQGTRSEQLPSGDNVSFPCVFHHLGNPHQDQTPDCQRRCRFVSQWK